MLGRNFPRLQIVEGDITPEGKLTNQALADAWGRSDFFVRVAGKRIRKFFATRRKVDAGLTKIRFAGKPNQS